MAKLKLGPQALLYPMPALLIGSVVAGKPNFMTAVWGGIACGDPAMVSVAIRPTRYTLKGINENKSFSINIPDAKLVKETDYCGIISGSKADKAAVCGFKVFFGQLAGDSPQFIAGVSIVVAPQRKGQYRHIINGFCLD